MDRVEESVDRRGFIGRVVEVLHRAGAPESPESAGERNSNH